MTKKEKNEASEVENKQEEEINEVPVSEDENAEEISETKTELNEDELKNLRKENENLTTKSQEYFEGWQRERADFMNYKKRIEREQASLRQYIAGEIVKKYLSVIDDMELAFKNKPDSKDCKSWSDGIELIYQKLRSILDSEGVEPIPAEGEMFDPNIHEAVTQIDSSEHDSGVIVEVMRQGYRIGDRIIRPALVIVAR